AGRITIDRGAVLAREVSAFDDIDTGGHVQRTAVDRDARIDTGKDGYGLAIVNFHISAWCRKHRYAGAEYRGSGKGRERIRGDGSIGEERPIRIARVVPVCRPKGWIVGADIVEDIHAAGRVDGGSHD